MERLSGHWKQYPLLLWGELPFALPEAALFSARSDAFPINNFYIVVALAASTLPEALSALAARRVSADQIVLWHSGAMPFSHPRLPFLGSLEIISGESAEEFRSRLLGRLETQRHKKLGLIFQEAAELGLARRLSEADLCAVLDQTRLAHALACAYGLPPEIHDGLLRASLGLSSPTPAAPWGPESSPQQLILDAAGVIQQTAARGGGFREALRERAAALPFRARTELLHHVETCLGTILKGVTRAA